MHESVGDFYFYLGQPQPLRARTGQPQAWLHNPLSGLWGGRQGGAEDAAPDGAWNDFELRAYKEVAPPGLRDGSAGGGKVTAEEHLRPTGV